MKSNAFVATVALTVLGMLAGPACAQADVVATVNGEQIARAALIERLIDQSTIGQGMLEIMIGERLLAQHAKKKGVEVTDQDVQARIAEMRKGQSDEAFKQFLVSNDLTEKGMPVFVRLNLLVEKLFGEMARVTDEDVRVIYDQNQKAFSRAAMFKVSVLQTRTEDEAKAARKRTESGESFSAVARAISMHLPTRPGGGLLGPATKDALDQLFKGAGDTAAALKVGDVSAPTKSEDGWWLVKVEESLAAANPSFQDLKERIRSDMRQFRLRQVYGAWLSEALRSTENKIERKL